MYVYLQMPCGLCWFVLIACANRKDINKYGIMGLSMMD